MVRESVHTEEMKWKRDKTAKVEEGGVKDLEER